MHVGKTNPDVAAASQVEGPGKVAASSQSEPARSHRGIQAAAQSELAHPAAEEGRVASFVIGAGDYVIDEKVADAMFPTAEFVAMCEISARIARWDDPRRP